MDTVQIFIPTFNRRDFLEKAISSAVNQTYGSVEIIVLDNASSDKTEVFMRDLVKHDGRIKYHRNSENLGMVGNFNQIRHFISQPFFCVLPDDDTYQSHFLTTVMELFHLYPSIAFACGNAPILRNGTIERDLLAEWSEGLHTKGSQIKACSQSKHPMFTHCIFRDYLAEEFIFDDAIWSSADGFLLTCLATKYNMAVCKTITGYWNIHGENSTEKQVWDPDGFINALAAKSRLYAEFCKKNNITNKLRGFYKQKLRIGLLQLGQKDKVSLDRITRSHEEVRKHFSPIECLVIRLLSSVPFLEVAIFLKGFLRRAKLVK